ncbi:MAG: PAS domain-containing protein [Magnetovibrio sp.]|nr:PAS domain-containing protein [Magnetovibrio sp.]
MSQETYLSGVERTFDTSDLIVSKTDTKGRMTYVNETFLRLAEYSEKECIGEPHNKIRHPDMPRCIFKLLWDTISKGQEIFAYVVNRSGNGDHYWVLAHVTASFDDNENIVGYHSSRRVASKAALGVIQPLYIKLKAEEDRHSDRKAGLEASMAIITDILEEADMSYGQFIFSVIHSK